MGQEYTEDLIRRKVTDAESVPPSPSATDAGSITQTVSTTESTSVSGRVPPAPSIEDALSTSFIDVSSAGTIMWPVGGTQKWEGRVTEVSDDVFTAELIPLGSVDKAPVTAEFRKKVLEADGIVELGDLFYVTEQEVRLRGLPTTQYSFRLRRPGNWTAKDIREIQERAKRRLAMLKDNVE
jgi:hypothetical protein